MLNGKCHQQPLCLSQGSKMGGRDGDKKRKPLSVSAAVWECILVSVRIWSGVLGCWRAQGSSSTKGCNDFASRTANLRKEHTDPAWAAHQSNTAPSKDGPRISAAWSHIIQIRSKRHWLPEWQMFSNSKKSFAYQLVLVFSSLPILDKHKQSSCSL